MSRSWVWAPRRFSIDLKPFSRAHSLRKRPILLIIIVGYLHIFKSLDLHPFLFSYPLKFERSEWIAFVSLRQTVNKITRRHRTADLLGGRLKWDTCTDLYSPSNPLIISPTQQERWIWLSSSSTQSHYLPWNGSDVNEQRMCHINESTESGLRLTIDD